MFTQQWTNRKREREDDEENTPSGFSEHRTVGLPEIASTYPILIDCRNDE
jgi:hypothetical protein